MTLPLEGRTIALAEGRQLEDLAAMLARESATPLRCPLLSILDNPDAVPVDAWIDELIADRFDLLIVMTGEAVRRLVPAADRMGKLERFTAARRVPKVSRPQARQGAARAEHHRCPRRLRPDDGRRYRNAGRRTARRKDGRLHALRQGQPRTRRLPPRRGRPRPVLSYVLAPAADADRVGAHRTNGRGNDQGIVFTSSPQVDRLLGDRPRTGPEPALLRGLARTQVAAVGPLVAESLHQHGGVAHVCPDQGWVMKNLVMQIVRSADR